jgi:hypothetical protein
MPLLSFIWTLAVFCFTFLSLYTVGWTTWTGERPFKRPLPAHRKTQTQKKRDKHPCLWVGLELTRAENYDIPNYHVLFVVLYEVGDRLCGLVVKVPAYRSWVPGLDYQRYQNFWGVVSMERSSLSLVRITEELFQGNSGSGLENQD